MSVAITISASTASRPVKREQVDFVLDYGKKKRRVTGRYSLTVILWTFYRN
jgi:hypothetical protein